MVDGLVDAPKLSEAVGDCDLDDVSDIDGVMEDVMDSVTLGVRVTECDFVDDSEIVGVNDNEPRDGVTDDVPEIVGVIDGVTEMVGEDVGVRVGVMDGVGEFVGVDDTTKLPGTEVD